MDAKFRSWISADVYKKTVEPTELFLPSKPRFPGLCSYDQWPPEIKLTAILKTCLNLFLLLPIRVLVRTDKFLEPIELLGSKSDSRNMKRHRIGPAFSKNSTGCTRSFSRRFVVFRLSRREKPLATRVPKRSLEETKRLGFFKNAYRNVRKAYFDRRPTQSKFCFETNILCDRRSVQWRTLKFKGRKTALQNKLTLKLVNKQQRLPISSSFTVFYSCLKPVLHNLKIFIGFRDHYE